MTLAVLYAAGAVRRYHANAAMARFGQTNADHQGRCAQLLLALNPDAGAALIDAVLHHDVGEYGAGDLPQPFKAEFRGVADNHAAVEKVLAARIMGRVVPDLTPDEARWLKLVDRLESHCFVLLERRAEYVRDGSGWRRAEVELIEMARDLGCVAAVERLIHDLKAGVW